jgi:hypothetical protein
MFTELECVYEIGIAVINLLNQLESIVGGGFCLVNSETWRLTAMSTSERFRLDSRTTDEGRYALAVALEVC